MDKINFKELIGFIGSIATVATVIVLACMRKAEGVVVAIVLGIIILALLLALWWNWLKKKIVGKIRSLIEETDFSQLNADVAELNKTKSEFDQRLDDCAASSKTATDKTDELKREITELHDEIAGFDQKVDACAASVKGITDKTDDFESKLSELYKKVDDYSDKNAKLEEKVQKLAEALEKLIIPISTADVFNPWDVAKEGDRQVLTINGAEFAFRYCPPGDFMMGSPNDDEGRFDNENYHNVNISEGFWICEVPTTQEQWDAIGLEKENKCYFEGAKLPIENVTWYESDTFIKKLNELGITPDGWRFELPTEEQWEYACRAGTTGSTYGVPLDEAVWYFGNSEDKTHEVGTKTPNKWRIFDMLGNVWEWTSSKYNDGSSFVGRGGGWRHSARYCRPAYRGYYDPACYSSNLGFRSSLVRR